MSSIWFLFHKLCFILFTPTTTSKRCILVMLFSLVLIDKEQQEARAIDLTLRREEQENLEQSQLLMPMLN